MSAARKGVLLRLSPDLLERIDAAAGALSRTEFLVGAITRHLDALEGAESLWEVEQNAWARQNPVEQGSPFPVASVSQAYPHGGKRLSDQEEPQLRVEEGSAPSSHQSSPGHAGEAPSDQGLEQPGTAAEVDREGSGLPPKPSGVIAPETASGQGYSLPVGRAEGELEVASNSSPSLHGLMWPDAD